MKISVIGKKCTPRDSFKERAEKKLSKIDRLFGSEAEAKVTAIIEKNEQIVEITIFRAGLIFRAQERAENLNDALDKCVDSLVRQLRKNKTKLEKKLRSEAFVLDAPESLNVVEDEVEYDIVRSKFIALKPQSVEEAILQMNILNHNFYMFINSEDDRICVVYARNDGGYGLLIPSND